MRGRLYDPKLGRFITADPYVTNPLDPQGLNRYSYVRNNPLNLVDPSGFSECSGSSCGGPTGVPPSYTGGSNPGGGGGSSAPSGTCNADGSYTYSGGGYGGDSDVSVRATVLPDGPNARTNFNSSSSSPGNSRGSSSPSTGTTTAPAPAASQPADGAPATPASQGSPQGGGPTGPSAAPPSPEGGPSSQGISGSGNVSAGSLANPVVHSQSPNGPAVSWSPGTTGAPSSSQASAVGYRGSNGGNPSWGYPTPNQTFNPGFSPNYGAGLYVAGVGVGIVQYSHVQGGMWRFPTNGNWENMAWAGNQYRMRSNVVGTAQAASTVGFGLFWVGAAMSATNGFESLSEGDYGGATKSGFDIGMSALGFAGPLGFVASTGYGGLNIMASVAGGWGNLTIIVASPPMAGFSQYRSY